MKVIPFYLPQFHRIPENDEWWGDGFTEWSNVKAAKPLFEGHEQPRIPLGHNYYDLSSVDTLIWQADLAKNFNIHGFCFYHYWFDGKLLLERPMELLRDNPQIDLNYMISWANENWTNGWVSDDNKVLIGHHASDPNLWVEHFDYLASFFKDPRYIREDGKPLLAIYVPHHIRYLDEMLDVWDSRAAELGIPGIKYIYQHPSAHGASNVNKARFSYGIEFQPQYQERQNKSKASKFLQRWIPMISGWLQSNFGVYLRLPSRQTAVTKIDYDDAWHNILTRAPAAPNLIPSGFVGWDNTPRKGHRGSVYTGGSPEKFGRYFKRLITKAKNEYPTSYVFLFAWNEWAEGGYLEPDEANGFGYLEAIRDAVASELPDFE